MGYVQQLCAWIFPIRREERGRFFAMCLLMFVTTFIHHLLRCLKDAYVLYEPGSGAEILSFLKTYLSFPMSILAAALYMYMRKHFDMAKTYYYIVGGFALFFLFYTCVLLPNTAYLHPDKQLVLALKQQYPMFRWFFTMWGMWLYALFYVAAELWGTYVLSVLFWQIANDTVKLEEAERFYPLFVTLSNIALFVLNPVVKKIAYLPGNGMVESSVIVVLGSCVLMFVFYYLNVYELSGQLSISHEPKIKQKKTSYDSGWKLAVRSEYVWYVALLVFCYAAIITLVETTWKAQVIALYVSKADQMAFQADYTLYTAMATVVMNALSKSVIEKLGWTAGAIITPISCGVLGSLFYALMVGSEFMWLPEFMQANIVPLAVGVGSVSVVLSRGAKYSFFDPTKEMAFIPLDKRVSMHGKAIVDGMSSKFGKSFGGWFISSSTMLLGVDLDGLCSMLAILVVVLSVFWLVAVLRLGVLYQRQIQLNETADLADQDEVYIQ